MRRYIVHFNRRDDYLPMPIIVVGDRVFVQGDLKFIRNVEGKQYGDLTACFAPGTWSHFKEIGEV